jgi:hypothetical protein
MKTVRRELVEECAQTRGRVDVNPCFCTLRRAQGERFTAFASFSPQHKVNRNIEPHRFGNTIALTRNEAPVTHCLQRGFV